MARHTGFEKFGEAPRRALLPCCTIRIDSTGRASIAQPCDTVAGACMLVRSRLMRTTHDGAPADITTLIARCRVGELLRP